jgi:flagellar hook protein FlgE
MSILKTMNTAATGLNAHGSAVDIVSDNLANLNTVGFKASRGRFEDVLGTTVARGRIDFGSGLGVRMGSVDQVFTQGSMLGTGVSTDLAIKGDGFFIVDGAFDGVSNNFYTRSGQMNVDANGFIVNPQGLRLQGYVADSDGALGSRLEDILIPPQDVVPTPTSAVTVSANLDALASVVTAADSPSFVTSVAVYDSLGAAHNVDIEFRRTSNSPSTWTYSALADGSELTGGTAGTPTEVAGGTLTFTSDGKLDTEVPTAGITAPWLNANAETLSFDFGDSLTTDSGTGLLGTTGFANSSSVGEIGQDGHPPGSLVDMSVSEDGTITGAFSNGRRRTLGQVAIARFRNNNGLVRSGAGLFIDSEVSGLPLVGGAATGSRGTILSEALEASNVDMAQEFVNLISYQRGFQANSRTISTGDEMLAEVVALKR